MTAPRIEVVDLDPERPGIYASYLIFSGGEVGVVDVGPARTISRLAGRLRKFDGKIKVFITHIHLDHAGGLGHLLEQVDVESVYVHPRAVRHLVDPSVLWTSSIEVLGSQAIEYGKPKPVAREKLVALSDGSDVRLGDKTVKAIFAEGHASHQVAFLLDDVLFPGDAVGEIYGGNALILTPPPFYGALALATLDKFTRYRPEVLAVPHFGMYDNAPEIIRRYKARLIKHLNEASRALKDGGLEALVGFILREEENRRAFEVLSSRGYPYIGDYATRCAKGLLGYVDKFGWV